MTWPIQPLWRKLLTRRRNNALTSSSSSSSIIELREKFVLDFCFVQMCIIIVILAVIAVRKFCFLYSLCSNSNCLPQKFVPSFLSQKKTDSTRVTRDKEHSSRRNTNSTWNKVALASLFVSCFERR